MSGCLRIPRDERAAAKLAKEVELLPELAPSLQVEIPRFEQVSADPPFVVYRLIRGEAAGGEDPSGVRAFLETLHALDSAGLPVPPPDDWIAARGRGYDDPATLRRISAGPMFLAVLERFELPTSGSDENRPGSEALSCRRCR
jgi:hypothetical protein